jgi:Uma2 family endonuclease
MATSVSSLPSHVSIPPTQEELPHSDDMPLETDRHVQQMNLLIEALRLHWADRTDVFVGGNMFVYFSMEQVRGRDFRGPDFFAVLGVPWRERLSWVVWEENKGPDIIIELLSESTAHVDKGEKLQVYQDDLRVPEYYWYDPFTSERAGFVLHGGAYVPIELDVSERLVSPMLNLALVVWHGTYRRIEAPWLRWATLDGVVLPTGEELAEWQRWRAEQDQTRADEERARADEERARADEERARADAAERRIAELEARLRQQSPDAEN